MSTTTAARRRIVAVINAGSGNGNAGSAGNGNAAGNAGGGNSSAGGKALEGGMGLFWCSVLGTWLLVPGCWYLVPAGAYRGRNVGGVLRLMNTERAKILAFSPIRAAR